jgi:hypothetical protein
MNENPVHGHVTALCRKCQAGSVMAVEETLEKANLHMFNLPQAFERLENKATSEEERAYFGGATFHRYAEDLYRVGAGDHDFIVTSVYCEGDFADCLAEFKQYTLLKFAEKKAQELVDQLFNRAQKPPTEKDQPADTSFNILNSLDLPEDFFGNLGAN